MLVSKDYVYAVPSVNTYLYITYTYTSLAAERVCGLTTLNKPHPAVYVPARSIYERILTSLRIRHENYTSFQK